MSKNFYKREKFYVREKDDNTALGFLFVGFLFAAYQAWRGSDLLVLAYAFMLLGIGSLIFCVLRSLQNCWDEYISHRKIREVEELKSDNPSN